MEELTDTMFPDILGVRHKYLGVEGSRKRNIHEEPPPHSFSLAESCFLMV